MGRRKTPGNRSAGGRKKKASKARDRQKWDYGNPVIQARRELFDAMCIKGGKAVDQVFDTPGQLWALDYFDGHGFEADLILDTMRRYGHGYWNRHKGQAPRCGQLERTDRANDPLKDTPLDLSYEQMSRALKDMPRERRALEELVIDWQFQDCPAPFAYALITTGLFQKGRYPEAIALSSASDHDRLGDALRATFRLIECGLQAKYRRAA